MHAEGSLHMGCTWAAHGLHMGCTWAAHGLRARGMCDPCMCARLHPSQASGALEATPLSGKPALSAPARDWWITLEANEDDVAGYVLGVQLLAAPPEVRP